MSLDVHCLALQTVLSETVELRELNGLVLLVTFVSYEVLERVWYEFGFEILRRE